MESRESEIRKEARGGSGTGQGAERSGAESAAAAESRSGNKGSGERERSESWCEGSIANTPVHTAPPHCEIARRDPSAATKLADGCAQKLSAPTLSIPSSSRLHSAPPARKHGEQTAQTVTAQPAARAAGAVRKARGPGRKWRPKETVSAAEQCDAAPVTVGRRGGEVGRRAEKEREGKEAPPASAPDC